MVKTEGLELETRKDIVYNYILKYPGLHLSELSRKLNIPKSTMDYHLNHLKKQEVIVKKSGDGYIRYYIAKKIGENDKKILNLLRQAVPQEIIMFLLLHPESSKIKISTYLKKHPTTISFHLNKLTSTDIIEIIPNGNEKRYRIKNSEYISDLLIKYKESFLDDTIDEVVYSLPE